MDKVRNAKILILNPPSPDEYYINRDLMGGMGVKNNFNTTSVNNFITKLKNRFVRIPVVQLVYAATILKNKGFEILVIDAANEDLTLSDIMPRITNFSPDYVVMSCSAGCFLYERDAVAKEIKEKLPNSRIIVQGDMVAEKPGLMLPNFDIAILGEIEKSIARICSNEDLSRIQGIAYIENNEVKKTAASNKLEKEELEELPFPNWGLFPYKKYTYYPMVTKTPLVSVQASRGCPYGCGYCPYSLNQGLKWRARDAKNIFEEMKYDFEEFGIRGFFFRDPLFSLDQKRVEDLCNLLIDNKLDVAFVFETRPELLSDATIDLLAKAGCECINFGIEDIHPEILQAINRKPINADKILETVHYCEKAGIKTTCFFVLGLPGSTRHTIRETIDFSLKLMPSQVEYKIATPFPGTKLYSMAKENNWLKHESFDYLGGYSAAMQISEELSPEYLRTIASKAFRRFYLNPKFILREVFTGRMFRTLSLLTK